MKLSMAKIKDVFCGGLVVVSGVLAVGCAGVMPVPAFQPGSSSLSAVEQSMGKPNMTWRNEQGRISQVAYSNQPGGYFTWMIKFNDQGTVTNVAQVMSDRYFAQIKNGMDGYEVHKILGPERSVDHFASLHQIDWNYGYCSDNDGRQIFSVSFDDRTQKVKGSVTTPDQMWQMGDNEEARCVPYIPSN